MALFAEIPAEGDARRYDIKSPVTLESIGQIESATAADVQAAVERGRKAQREWATRSSVLVVHAEGSDPSRLAGEVRGAILATDDATAINAFSSFSFHPFNMDYYYYLLLLLLLKAQ